MAGTQQPIGQKQAPRSTQSDASLSKAADDEMDEASSVAEEVNLDEQSAQARRVGQMSDDPHVADAIRAIAESQEQDKQETASKEKLKASMERAVPPSE